MSTNTETVIVAGDDLAETGMTALRDALRRAPFAHLHVVHVVNDEDLGQAPGETLLERQTHLLEHLPPKLWDRVGVAGSEVGGLPELEVSVHVRFGAPSKAINQIAADYDADLVVVGTHGRRGVQRFVLGSVAEALVRTASCPVLIARPKDHSGVRKSERPEPAVAGEDIHRQRPEGAHVYVSSQLMTWTKRDVDAIGPGW